MKSKENQDVRKQHIPVHMQTCFTETISWKDAKPLCQKLFAEIVLEGEVLGLFFQYVHNPVLILEISCFLSSILFLVDLSSKCCKYIKTIKPWKKESLIQTFVFSPKPTSNLLDSLRWQTALFNDTQDSPKFKTHSE